MWSPMASPVGGYSPYGEGDGMTLGATGTARAPVEGNSTDLQTPPAFLASSDKELTVTPGAAHFNDVQPGQTYQLTVSIRNTSSKTKRIRVLPPSSTRAFAIHYDTHAASSLAPGMSLPCTIMFSCPPDYMVPRGSEDGGESSKAIAVDSLMIRSDTASVSIPARAFPPAPRLVVDMPVVDFGPLLAGTSASKVIRVTNVSTLMGGEAVFIPSQRAEGLVMALPDRVALAAATPDAIAGQRNSGLFKLELNTAGADEGPIEVQATITIPGSACSPVPITIKARVSEHIMSVLDADNGDIIKLETPVELGTTFYGAVVRQQIVIFNDGPVPVTFSISSKDGLPEFQATANADDGLSVTSRGSVVTAAASANRKREAGMFNASSVNAALNRITSLSNPPLATPRASRPGTAAAIHTMVGAAGNAVAVPGAPGVTVGKPPLQGGNVAPGGAPEPMGIGIAGSGCQHLRVSPREGTLKPYEKKVLTISFKPHDLHTPSGFKAQVELATDRQRAATKKLVSLLGPAGAPLPLASPFSGTKLPAGFTGEALASLTAGRDVFAGAAQALALGTVDPGFKDVTANGTARSDASRDPHAPATLPMPPNPYARPLGNYYHTDSRIRLAEAEGQWLQGASGAAVAAGGAGAAATGVIGSGGGGVSNIVGTGKAGPLATLLNSPAHVNANKKALAAKGIAGSSGSAGLSSPDRMDATSPDRAGNEGSNSSNNNSNKRPQSASSSNSGGNNTLNGSGDGSHAGGLHLVSKKGPPLLSALNPADLADREAARMNAVARAQTIATISPFQIASEAAVPPPPAETIAATITVHVPQLELDIPIIVYGIAERAIVEASAAALDFGDTPISGRSDAVLSVTSFTRSLPVRVRVGKMANITAEPSSVLLPAGETRTLHFTYQPTRLAPLHDTLPVTISLVSPAALEAIRELQKLREEDEMEAKGIVPYERQKRGLHRTGRSRSPEKGPKTGEPAGKFAAAAAAESATLNAADGGGAGDGGPGRGKDNSSSAVAAQRALATGQLSRVSAGATILRSKITKELRVHDPAQAMQILVDEAHAEAEQRTKMAIAEAKARGDAQGAVVAAQALSQEVVMFALPVKMTGKPVAVAPSSTGQPALTAGPSLLGASATGVGAWTNGANRLMDRTLANSPIASPPPEAAHGDGFFAPSSPQFKAASGGLGASTSGRYSPGPDPNIADVAEAAARLSQLGVTGGGADDGVAMFDAADGEQRQHLKANKQTLQALGSPTRGQDKQSSLRPNSGNSVSGKVKLPPASPLRTGGIGSGGGMATLLQMAATNSSSNAGGFNVPSLMSKGPDFAPASAVSQAFAGAVNPIVFTPGLNGTSSVSDSNSTTLIKVGPNGEATAVATMNLGQSATVMKPHKEVPITAFGTTVNKIVAPSGVPAAGVAAALFATAAANTTTAVIASGQAGTSTLQAGKLAGSGANTFSQRIGAAASAAEGSNPAAAAAASAINAAGLDVSVGAIISIANATHSKSMKEAGARAAAAVAGVGGLRGTQGVTLLPPGSGFGPTAVSGNGEPAPPTVGQLFTRAHTLRARGVNDPLEALLPEMRWADQSGQLKDRLQNGASLPPSAMKQSVPAAQLANTVAPLVSNALVAMKRGPGFDPAAAAAALSKLPASLLAAMAASQGGNGVFRTAPAVKLPFWGMIAARKGLGETDVSSSPHYTYTIGQIHARQMHREAYIAYLRSAAGNKKPMPPHGAAGSHVSAGSRNLLARIGRLTQRGVIPTLEDEEAGPEKKAGGKGGDVPRWDPEESVANPSTSLGLRDGKRDLAEPKLVLPFDPSTIAATEPLWLLRPIPGRGGGGLGGTSGGASGTSSMAATKYRHNPDKLIKKKHKPLPTTKGENIDCSQTLTDDQQGMISAGPTVLQFGVFNVRTEVKKNFTVVNDLAQSILVELNIDEEDTPQLIRSTPTSQVIPAGAIAGFDITFYTEEAVDMRELVRYTINRQHTGQFLVTATALPIVVTLSKRDCNLRFSEASLDRMSADTVMLHNPGSSPAEYKWVPVIPQDSAITSSASAVALLTRAGSRPGTAAALAAQREAKEAAALAKRTGQTIVNADDAKRKKKDDVPPPSKAAHVAAQVAAASGFSTVAANPLDSFAVEPLEGVIAPGKSVQARFTYTPLGGALTSVRYQLQVLGGPPGDNGTVTLHGDEQSTAIVCKEPELDFGNMGVGLTRELTLNLVNDSNNTGQNAPGVWYVAKELLPVGVTVEPQMGRLAPGESVEIGVSIFSKQALRLLGSANKEHGITFHTRGGPSFTVPISANVIVPNVKLIDALGSLLLDFGGVLIGAMNRKRVAIVNKSPISTEVCVDLSHYEDWYIAPPTLFAGVENDGTSIGDDSLIQAESVGGFSLTSDRFSVLQKNETAAALAVMNAAANNPTSPNPVGSPNAKGKLSSTSRKSVVAGGGSSVSPPPSAGTSISRAGRRRNGRGISEDALSAAGDDEDEDDEEEDKENSAGGNGDAPGAGIPQPDGTVALPNLGAADADDLGMLGALVAPPPGAKKKSENSSVVARDADGKPLSDIDPVPDDPRLVSLPRTFKVKLQPDGTLPFDLIFRPTSRKEYDFHLPVTVTGCGTVPELARQVVGYGVKPKMRAEPSTTIDFELKVVSPDPTRRVPYSQTFAIRNTDDDGKEVRWRADTSNLKPSFGNMQQAFFFEPSSGVIPPGEMQVIKVRFAPDSVRSYVNTVPIYLIDEDGNDVGSVIPSPRPQTPAGSSVFSGYTAARDALLSRGTITDGTVTNSNNDAAASGRRPQLEGGESDRKEEPASENDADAPATARDGAPPPAPPQPIRSGQLSPNVSRPPSRPASPSPSRPTSARALGPAATAGISAAMKSAQAASAAKDGADGGSAPTGPTGNDLVSAAEQAMRVQQATSAALRFEEAAKATNDTAANQSNQTAKQRELAASAALAALNPSTGRPSTSNTMMSGRTAFSVAGYGGGAATAGGYLQPYIELELKGSGMLPCLSFDTRDVVLPPVPLGAESRATFYICAHGYDHLTLQHKLTVGSYAAAAGMAGGPGPFAGSTRDKDGRSTAFVGPGPGTLANFVQGPAGAEGGMMSPSRGTAGMLARGASSATLMSPNGGPPGTAGGFSVGAPATRGAAGGFGGGGFAPLSPVKENPNSGGNRPGSPEGLASPVGFRSGNAAGSAVSSSSSGFGNRPQTAQTVGTVMSAGGNAGGHGSASASGSVYGGDADRHNNVTFQRGASGNGQNNGAVGGATATVTGGVVGGAGALSGAGSEAVQQAVEKELMAIPLIVTYPCGNILSMSRPRIPITVCFKSAAPMAFTILLEFRDPDGRPFTIPVSGCADSSVLTTFPYLEANCRRLAYSTLLAPPPIMLLTEGNANATAAAGKDVSVPATAANSSRNNGGGGTLGIGSAAPGEAALNASVIPPSIKLIGLPPSKSGGVDAPSPIKTALQLSAAAASAAIAATAGIRKPAPPLMATLDGGGSSMANGSDDDADDDANRSGSKALALPIIEAIPPPMSLPHLRNILRRVYAKALAPQPTLASTLGALGLTSARADPAQIEAQKKALAQQAAEKKAQQLAVNIALTYGTQASLSLPPPQPVWPVRGPSVPVLSSEQSGVLMRWLNTVLFRSPIAKFPDDLAAQHAKPVIDAIEAYSGATVPGKFKGRVPGDKRERAIVMFNQARDLLAFLRGQGAMLPHIRPEALLLKEDFARVRKYQHKGAFGAPWGAHVLQYLSPAERIRRRKFLSAAYPQLSLEAWTAVCLQVVRMYLLPRVSLGAVLTVAGVILGLEGEEYLRYVSLRESALGAAAKVLDDKNGSAAGGGGNDQSGVDGGGSSSSAEPGAREKGKSASHRLALEAALNAIAAASAAAVAEGCAIPLSEAAASGKLSAAAMRRNSLASEGSQQLSAVINPQGSSASAAGSGVYDDGSAYANEAAGDNKRRGSSSSSSSSSASNLFGAAASSASTAASNSNNLVLKLRAASKPFQQLAYAIFTNAGAKGTGFPVGNLFQGLGIVPSEDAAPSGKGGKDGPLSPKAKAAAVAAAARKGAMTLSSSSNAFAVNPAGFDPSSSSSSSSSSASGSSSSSEDTELQLEEDEDIAAREGLDVIARAAGSRIPLDLSQILSERSSVARLLSRLVGPDHGLLSSNLYSTSEGLLLRWLTYHRNRGCAAAALPFLVVGGDKEKESSGSSGKSSRPGTRANSASGPRGTSAGSRLASRGNTAAGRRGKSSGGTRAGRNSNGGDNNGEEKAHNPSWRVDFIPRRIVSFDADIRDLSAFVFALVSHCPELAMPGRVLDFSSGAVHAYPCNHAQRRNNALAIMRAFQELDLEAPFTADDLCPPEDGGAPLPPGALRIANNESGEGSPSRPGSPSQQLLEGQIAPEDSLSMLGNNSSKANGAGKGNNGTSSGSRSNTGSVADSGAVAASMTDLGHVPSTGLLLAACQIAGEPVARSDDYFPPPPVKGTGGLGLSQPLFSSPAAVGTGPQFPDGLTKLPVPALTHQDVFLPPPPLPEETTGKAGRPGSAGSTSGLNRTAGALTNTAANSSNSSTTLSRHGSSSSLMSTQAKLSKGPVVLPVTTLNSHVSARNGLLWCLWLYQTLPGLVPRHLIDFEGSSGDRIVRSVTLTNPTTRPITYQVLLEGAEEFSLLSASQVRIEPSGTSVVSIACCPRFARPVHAKLSCRSKRDGALMPQMLAFTCRSRVVRRPPVAQKEATARTYASAVVDVEVRNNFSADGLFRIAVIALPNDALPGNNLTIEAIKKLRSDSPCPFVVPPAAAIAALQSPISLNSMPMLACPPPPINKSEYATIPPHKRVAMQLLGRAPKSSGPAVIHTGVASHNAGVFPADSGSVSSLDAGSFSGARSTGQGGGYVGSSRPGEVAAGLAAMPPPPPHTFSSFWCKYAQVFLRAGQAKKIPVQFAPLHAGTHRAALVLTDVNFQVGEMVIELTGRATAPVPFSKLYDRVTMPPLFNPNANAKDTAAAFAAGGGAGGSGGNAADLASAASMSLSKTGGLRVTFEEPGKSLASAAIAALGNGSAAANPSNTSGFGGLGSAAAGFLAAQQNQMTGNNGSGNDDDAAGGGSSKAVPILNVVRLLSIPPLNPQLESARDALIDRLERSQRSMVQKGQDMQRVADAQDRLKAMTLLRTFGIAGTRPGRVKGGSVYATASAATAAGVPSGNDTANGKVKAGAERPSTAAVGVLNATAAVIASAGGRPPLAPAGSGGSVVGGSIAGGGAGSAGYGGAGSAGGGGSVANRGMGGGASTVGGNNPAGGAGSAGGGDSWLQSAMNAIQGTGGGVVSNAAEKPPGIPQDVAEELINAIGRFYSVQVDSPFFEVPPVIFVPGPLFPLTGAQVVAAAAAAVSPSGFLQNKDAAANDATLARLAQTNPAAAAMLARKTATATAAAATNGGGAAPKEGTALLHALTNSSSNFGSSVSNPATPAIGSRAHTHQMTHGIGSAGAFAKDIAAAVNAASTIGSSGAGGGANGSGRVPMADGNGILTANGRLNILPLVPPASGSTGASLVQQLTANLAAAVISNPQQAVALAAQAMTSGALQALIAPTVGPVPPTATPRTPQALAAQLAANVLGAPTPKATTEMATELANQLPELYSPETVAEAFARGEQASMEMLAKLPVTLKARHAGVYSTRITLINDAGKLFGPSDAKRNKDGSSKDPSEGNDVRVYDIEIALEASSPTPSLTYTTSAHKAVTQLVPITNTTDQDWIMEACFQATAHMAPGRYGPVSNLMSPKDPSSPLRNSKALLGGGTVISPRSGVGATGMLTAGGWSSPGAASSRMGAAGGAGGDGSKKASDAPAHNGTVPFTHHFSCPLRLHVPPYQCVNLPVTFAPTEVCEDSALLVLKHVSHEEAALANNRLVTDRNVGTAGDMGGNSSGGLVTAGHGRDDYSHSRPNTTTNLMASSPPPSRFGLLSAPGTSAGGDRPTFNGGSGVGGPSEGGGISVGELKFDLHGIATEPLASDFLYASCAARDTVTLTVPVHNHDATGSAGIVVDCNLPAHLGFEGITQVSVPAATLISDPRSNIGAPPMVTRPSKASGASAVPTTPGGGKRTAFALNTKENDDDNDGRSVDSRAGDHSGPPSPTDHTPVGSRPGSPGIEERQARGESAPSSILAKKRSKKQLAEGGYDPEAPMAGQAVVPGETMYSFTLKPSVSGNFAGSISFRHPRTRALHWYGVEVTVTEANPVATIQMVTVARSATTATLEIANPTPEAATFDVACIGEGVLGDSVIVVPGNGSRVYEVIFAPLLPTTDEPAPQSVLANPSLLSQAGASAVGSLVSEGRVVPNRGAVRFTSAGAGEYTYSLELVAFPSPPISVQPVSCPLGERVRIPFTIENPTSQPAIVYGAVDDGEHYLIDFEEATSGPVIETLQSDGSGNASTAIVPIGGAPGSQNRRLGDLARAAEISPMSSRTVFIVFTPSAIGVRQPCTALLTSDTIGEWELSLSGSGLPPRRQDEVAVSTPVGTTATAAFVFRNPFPSPVYVLPRLEINGTMISAAAVGSAAAAVAATNRSAAMENLHSRFASSTGAGMGVAGAATASSSLRMLVDHAVTSAFGGGASGDDGSAPSVTLLRDKPIRVPAYGSVQVPFAFAPTAISEASGEAQLLVWPERVEDGFALGFAPLNGATPAQYQQQQQQTDVKEGGDDGAGDNDSRAGALADQQDSWYARLPGAEDNDARSVDNNVPPMPFSPLRVPSSPTSSRFGAGAGASSPGAGVRSPAGASSRPAAAAPSAASYSVFAPLKWSYPVRCTAEAPVAAKVVKITCPARQSLVTPFVLPLPGFEMPSPGSSAASSSSHYSSSDGSSNGNNDVAGVSFAMAVVPAPSALKHGAQTATGVHLDAEGVQQMVRQAVKVLPKRNRLYSSREPVELEVVLQPSKALASLPVELLITAMRGGGAWRFPLLLNFPPAAADGTITIESPRGVPGTRVITIRNVVPTASKFKCYLTPDTPGEFRCSPSEGVLPPGPKRDTSGKGARNSLANGLTAGGAGGADDGSGSGSPVEWFEGYPPSHVSASEGWTSFTVVFTPREYGRTCAGRMVIETDNFTWTFSLRGRLPTYVPPELQGTVGAPERGGSGGHFAAFGPTPRRR